MQYILRYVLGIFNFNTVKYNKCLSFIACNLLPLCMLYQSSINIYHPALILHPQGRLSEFPLGGHLKWWEEGQWLLKKTTHSRFKKFQDRSEYSYIEAGRLEPAGACLDMHASYTCENCLVAIRLACMIDPRESNWSGELQADIKFRQCLGEWALEMVHMFQTVYG
jgi:hypothetical protein